jgi:hypothetical protein
MLDINYLAVITAAVAAFIVSSVWYVVFSLAPTQPGSTSPDATSEMNIPPWKMLAEFGRSLIVAFVLARFIVLLDVSNWLDAVQFGAWVWLGFPTMILLGSVLWENVPWKTAVTHIGDWLVKLLVMALILGLWR